MEESGSQYDVVWQTIDVKDATQAKDATVSGGTITIINRPKIEISIKKVWENYSSDEYLNYVVKMKLQRTKDNVYFEDVEEITLDQEHDWKYVRKNLDLGYTYSVKEIEVLDAAGKEVNNFDTTYSGTLTTTGTITVTNTKKPQEIILPGTGGKDGWIFYGLGISFWAISLIWLSLTFKKRNKLIKAAKEGRKGIP